MTKLKISNSDNTKKNHHKIQNLKLLQNLKKKNSNSDKTQKPICDYLSLENVNGKTLKVMKKQNIDQVKLSLRSENTI